MPSPHNFRAPPPSGLLMHAGMFLTGLGMTVVGPILPALIACLHLPDSRAGLLLSAQFLGMSIGSIAIGRRLLRGLVVGIATCVAGFGGLALVLHTGLPPGVGPAAPLTHAAGASPAVSGAPVLPYLAIACGLLWLTGFGLGHLITAINLIGGQRYGALRGSALSLLNFSWSVGAVLSPLLAALVLPHFSIGSLFGLFGIAFFLLGLESCRQALLSPPRGNAVKLHPGTLPLQDAAFPPAEAAGIAWSTLLLFAATFFFYGGMESSLSGWLATYTVRYGGHQLAISEFSTLVFWVSLTCGRGITSLVLLRVSERTLRLTSLLLVVSATLVLVIAHSMVAITVCSLLVGLGLAPCFPATLSMLLQTGPRNRQAALALASTALGGATVSWMLGQLSTRAHSLHTALLLPLASGVALLAICLLSLRNLNGSCLHGEGA